MNTYKKYLGLIMGLVIGGGFLFVGYKTLKNNDSAQENLVSIYSVLSDSQKQSAEKIKPEKQEEIKITNESTGSLYESEKYSFSFKYPSNFSVDELSVKDGSGDIILVQEKSGEIGFQVFISQFDETGSLTPERIKRDLPNITIENPQNVILSDGIVALIFISSDPTIGETREVWFVKGGYLYQVSTFAYLDSWLAGVMSTWRFY